MNLWTALVAMAGIWGVVQIAQYWINAREQQEVDVVSETDRAQIDELKSRIETLETIITDNRESLKRKIDNI
mgnify:CR=1 FL=1